MRIFRGNSVSELMHIRFAKHHSSSAMKSFDNCRVDGRNKIFQHSRSCGGSNSSRPNIVFERYRNSIQRTARFSAHESRFRLSRRAQGLLRRHREIRVQLRVVFFDAGNKKFRQLYGEISRRSNIGASSSIVANAGSNFSFDLYFTRRQPRPKNLFLLMNISKRTDVCDHQRYPELILEPNRRQFQTPVFKRQPQQDPLYPICATSFSHTPCTKWSPHHTRP